jgi:hypothetical protein
MNVKIKGLQKFAFCERLILKGAILVVFERARAEVAALKRNAGASSPHFTRIYLQG